MKILFTTQYLDNFSGTELVTLELSQKFKDLGHEVFVYAPVIGEIGKLIRKNKISVTNDIKDYININFDIIHSQHNVTAILARSIFPLTPMVYMSHGVVPDLEQPPSIDLEIFKFIAISEEVRDNLVFKHGILPDMVVILRNFVDMKKYSATLPINNTPQRLLVISNHYSDKQKVIIEESCLDLGIHVHHIGRPENVVENVVDYINNADIVVSLGRGALAALACGRNVIVFDIHGGDGLITEDNFKEIRKNNFSGRHFSKFYNVEEFKNEISKYNPAIGKKILPIIEKENNIDIISQELISIYNDAMRTAVKTSLIKKGMLYNEFSFLLSKIGELYYDNKCIKIRNKDNISLEISQLKADLSEVYSSRFWKMRELYMKIKYIFIK